MARLNDEDLCEYIYDKRKKRKGKINGGKNQ